MKQTVTSKYEPKSKNVTWIDMSSGSPVLKNFINGMWKSTGGGGGGGSSTNPGYNVTKQTVSLFNDTIETQESGGIYLGGVENIDFDLIAGENYTVVFDGTSYSVKAIVSPFDEDAILLGEMSIAGPSFETYPFVIMYVVDEGTKGMMFVTPIEGSHTVEIKHEEEAVTATPEFKSAVDSVTGYSINKSYQTYLPEQYIETTQDGDAALSTSIEVNSPLQEGSKYVVTFNGEKYEVICTKYETETDYFMLGDYIELAYDDRELVFTNYPFFLQTYYSEYFSSFLLELCTEQAGTYSVKVEEVTEEGTTTPGFESMIQDIVGGEDSPSGCKIIYPDSISWIDTLYSQYNNEPEAGNIYFIPFIDHGSTDGQYLYQVHIDELTNDNNQFSGYATIIGTPIIVDNGTLTIQPFDSTINPVIGTTNGLCIKYYNNAYRLSYGFVDPG